jgi:hypothetical protein
MGPGAARYAAGDADASGFSPGGIRDFAAYWAASRLLLTGGNPYSPTELLTLQRSIGMTERTALIMWNPPWALSFVLPFGFLDFTVGQFLWLVVHVLLMLFAAQQLWKIYSKSAEKRWIPNVLAFVFIPSVYSLILGQITPLILFGLVAFVLLERKQNRILIGVVLALLSIKPHFIYGFWIVVLLWVWQRRDWQIAASALIAGFIAALLPVLFDPEIYSQYIKVYQSNDYLKPFDLPVPSLRNVLRFLFNIQGSYIEYSPTALGAVWLVYYWFRHHDKWTWSEHLPFVLLVSVTTSPYTWTFDQIVLLPAIIRVFSLIGDKQRAAMVIYGMFNAVYLGCRYLVPVDFWYFWMAPTFLVGYLVWQRQLANSAVTITPLIAKIQT